MDNLYTFAVYTADPEELDYYTVPVPEDIPALDIEAWYENKYKERVHSFWKKRTAEETRQWLDNWRKARGFTNG